MKLGMLKFRMATAVGVYLNDTTVAWCVLEKSAFGTRQTDAGEAPCTKQDWAVALHRVLAEVKEKQGESAFVVVGLPASHTFFATLGASGKTESAEQLLAGNHCCTSIPPSELSADVLPVKLNGKSYAAVAASRKRDLQVLIDVPRKLGFRFVRIEPAPWALLRSSSTIKGNKIAVRLMVDRRHVVATLTSGGMQPLLWRSIELPQDPDAAADMTLSLVRTFESYATQHLGVPQVDLVVLEGPECEPLGDRLGSDLGERFCVADGPGPTPAAKARGLALGGLERDKPAPDLARTLAPPPRLWDLVPIGEIAVLGAVIICMGLWMWSVGTIAQNKATRAEEENDKNPVLRVEDVKLKDEKKVVSAEVQAVSTFLTNRILWTEYLSEFSRRVPDGVKFASFQGEFELTTGGEKGEKKAKRQLLLTFSAFVPRELSAPPEVDPLLNSIRSAPMVQRDFPDVKLTTLRINKSQDAKRTVLGDPASFTITCLPRGKETKGKGKSSGGTSAVAKTD